MLGVRNRILTPAQSFAIVVEPYEERSAFEERRKFNHSRGECGQQHETQLAGGEVGAYGKESPCDRR